MARRRDREFEIVEVPFDADKVPAVPAFLWKWRNYATSDDVPPHGEPGVCFYIADEATAYLWVGELRVMRVGNKAPADVMRKAFGQWIVSIDWASGPDTMAWVMHRDAVRVLQQLSEEEETVYAEDQLTPDERRRLEALAQAIAYSAIPPKPKTSAGVIALAAEFEKWIENGTPEPDEDEEPTE